MHAPSFLSRSSHHNIETPRLSRSSHKSFETPRRFHGLRGRSPKFDYLSVVRGRMKSLETLKSSVKRYLFESNIAFVNQIPCFISPIKMGTPPLGSVFSKYQPTPHPNDPNKIINKFGIFEFK